MSANVQPGRGNAVRLCIWGDQFMHYRMASAAVAFSLMAAPLAADIPKPVVGKVPAADISDDQALGCMLVTRVAI